MLLILSAINGHFPRTPSGWLSPISLAVTVSGAALWVFDRWVWRWPIVRRLSGRPVLHGTWHGTLASSWVDPGTGIRVDPDNDVFLVLRQRYWRVTARLLTRESSSVSLVSNFVVGVDGVQQLVWVYLNNPRADVRDRSQLHYGAAILTAPRQPGGARPEGIYFTDRKTLGDITFAQHFPKLIETHAEGFTLVQAAPATVQPGRRRLTRPKTWLHGS